MAVRKTWRRRRTVMSAHFSCNDPHVFLTVVVHARGDTCEVKARLRTMTHFLGAFTTEWYLLDVIPDRRYYKSFLTRRSEEDVLIAFRRRSAEAKNKGWLPSL